MSIMRSVRLVAIIAVLGVVLAACGGGAQAATPDPAASEQAEASDTATIDEQNDAEANNEDGDGFAFGQPGNAAEADRAVEIDAGDDFAFSPAEINVSVGETITFVVTNTGVIPHDFTLGDQATQDAHEAEMADMAASGDMGELDDTNAMVLDSGETKELTWTFSEAGTVLIGCHQPGHYAAGMRGAVEVDG